MQKTYWTVTVTEPFLSGSLLKSEWFKFVISLPSGRNLHNFVKLHFQEEVRNTSFYGHWLLPSRQ